MSQTDPFAGIEPRALWSHFSAFTKIARPSGQEAAIAAHVRDWAASRNLEAVVDAVGNVIVRVPATKGREKAPTVILQGHLDMVCERNASSPHDPERGDIHVVRDGDFLRADGTTLGADNGIGVAAGMAVADDPTVVHGPLELVMTIDEETGMTGAQGLDGSLLKGRIMLNLDSEEDTALFVGCAGGGDLRFQFEGTRAKVEGTALAVKVEGLQGGHSGIDINNNRANAIHTIVRLVQEGAKVSPVCLASIAGGSKRNAIPREAHAVVVVPADKEAAFRAALKTLVEDLRFQFKGLDDGLDVKVEAASASDAFGVADSARLLDFLRAMPSGVVAMSKDLAGLVESSTNLGVVSTKGNEVEILTLARSSVMPALRDMLDAQTGLARLAGIKSEYLGGYPGWKPNMESKVLDVTRKAYARLFGHEAGITAIHAGLECGLIGERIHGMDMVSFGPLLVGVHAPNEKVSIPSAQKFWKLLGAVLDDLSA